MMVQSLSRSYIQRKPWFEGHMHHRIHCSTIYNSQDMEATQIPVDKWMDEEDVVYLYNGYYSAIKNNNVFKK